MDRAPQPGCLAVSRYQLAKVFKGNHDKRQTCFWKRNVPVCLNGEQLLSILAVCAAGHRRRWQDIMSTFSTRHSLCLLLESALTRETGWHVLLRGGKTTCCLGFGLLARFLAWQWTHFKTSVYPLAAATCIAVPPDLACRTSLIWPLLSHCRASRSMILSSSFLAASMSTPGKRNAEKKKKRVGGVGCRKGRHTVSQIQSFKHLLYNPTKRDASTKARKHAWYFYWTSGNYEVLRGKVEKMNQSDPSACSIWM